MSARPEDLAQLLAQARGAAWGDRHQRAAELARGLIAGAGVVPGDRVAVLRENGEAALTALFAVWLAGGIAVPIAVRQRDTQVRHVLDDSGARVLLTGADHLLALSEAERTLAGAAVYADGEGPLPAGATPLAALAGADAALPELRSDDLAVLLYTSGSTGLPKGIVQDHHNLVLGAELVAGYLDLSPSDHVLGVLPLAFDYGLNQALSAAWVSCGLTLRPFVGGHDALQALAQCGGTVLAGVPYLWAAVCDALRADGDAGARARARAAGLRVATNSGGRFRRRDIATLRQLLPAVRVFAMYGLTEAFRSCFLDPDRIDERPHSVGRALPGVELLVVDPATGARCALGEVGELVHAGALVAKGYWRQPQATARRFRPHPFDPAGGPAVFTGDLARIDAEGFVEFVARADQQLKVRGQRVAPDEVERELEQIDGVARAVVVGVADDAAADTRLVAFVQGDPADRDLADRVRAAARRRLPPPLQPAEVCVLAALPLTATGKPDRPALARVAEKR